MNDPKPVSVINTEELVRRIESAKQMRAEGAPESEIKAVEPSEEEIKAALMELRQDRGQINVTTNKRKKKTAPKQPKDLDSLLGTPL